MRYDLIILGREASGLEAALHAAKLRKRTAVVDCQPPTSREAERSDLTLSDFRDAALLLTGFRHRHVSPDLFARRRKIAMRELRYAAREIAEQRDAATNRELNRHRIELFSGNAQFVEPHAVTVARPSQSAITLNGDKIMVAVGTQPRRPNSIPFDGESILDEEELLSLDHLPKSLIVLGNELRALECAMTFAILGVRVAWVSERKRIIPFCDDAVEAVFRLQAERHGLRFRLGRKVQSLQRSPDHRATMTFENGSRLFAERVIRFAPRFGNTSSLNLSAAGLMSDEYGRLWCNEHFQSWATNIYGVGSVVGFPNADGLLKHGVRAVDHAFGWGRASNQPSAYGISTIPEFAAVGAMERQLRSRLVHYEVGIHRFQNTSRGHLGGPRNGMLKLMFDRESRQLLGVHWLGEGAKEAIQLGQTVMALGGTLETLAESSLNNSAIGENYHAAAQDGLRRLKNSPANAYRPARTAKVDKRSVSVG